MPKEKNRIVGEIVRIDWGKLASAVNQVKVAEWNGTQPANSFKNSLPHTFIVPEILFAV